MRRSLVLALLFVFVLLMAGCKDQDEAASILPKACTEFPDTEIYKFDKRILWVQTHVDGISSEVAEKIYRQACAEAGQNFGKIKFNIGAELAFDQRQILIVGFRHYWVIWLVRDGVDQQGIPVNYKVTDLQGLQKWFGSHLGYFPSSDKIGVVTLQDVQETPKGQPMTLQSLTEVANKKRAKMIEDLQEQQNNSQ